jgi:hypothetical protein
LKNEAMAIQNNKITPSIKDICVKKNFYTLETTGETDKY